MFKINQDEKDKNHLLVSDQRNARRIRLRPVFNSVAKVLGIIAILIPGFPGIEEWTYAGLFFALVGATFSIYSSGERGANLAFMRMPILLEPLSYLYYRRRQSSSQNEFNFA